MSLLVECCENPQKHHGAVYEKYSDKRYKRASVFAANEVKKGFLQLDYAANLTSDMAIGGTKAQPYVID